MVSSSSSTYVHYLSRSIAPVIPVEKRNFFFVFVYYQCFFKCLFCFVLNVFFFRVHVVLLVINFLWNFFFPVSLVHVKIYIYIYSDTKNRPKLRTHKSPSFSPLLQAIVFHFDLSPCNLNSSSVGFPYLSSL